MAMKVAEQVKALAQQIKAANRGHQAEIDRLADEIIRVLSASPQKAAGLKFYKLIPPGGH